MTTIVPTSEGYGEDLCGDALESFLETLWPERGQRSVGVAAGVSSLPLFLLPFIVAVVVTQMSL